MKHEDLQFFVDPPVVRCSLRLNISTICLNNSKSACFWVINWYFIKWSIITFKSLIEFTRYWIASLPCFVIFPTPPKYDRIDSNKTRSFLCNPSWNVALTVKPCFCNLFLYIQTIKELSASANPVINQGDLFASEDKIWALSASALE